MQVQCIAISLVFRVRLFPRGYRYSGLRLFLFFECMINYCYFNGICQQDYFVSCNQLQQGPFLSMAPKAILCNTKQKLFDASAMRTKRESSRKEILSQNFSIVGTMVTWNSSWALGPKVAIKFLIQLSFFQSKVTWWRWSQAGYMPLSRH